MGSNLSEFVIRRRKYWLINTFLYYWHRISFLQKLFFRDNRLWIFGAWAGTKYDDNSKYFFEYVNKNHPEINAVWLSPNQDVVDNVVSLGYKSVLSTSDEGRKIQKKAGKAFFTNGWDDFGNICYAYGAQGVSLWHGVGLGLVYFLNRSRKGLLGILKRIKENIFNFAERDITLTTTRNLNDWQMKAFKIPRNNIFLTGQPRNDVFKNCYKPSEVLLNLENADEYKYVVYMPTHRSWYSDDFIKNIVVELINNERFVKYLRDNRIRFLLKLHFLTELSEFELPDEFAVLRNEDVLSVQMLLSIADVLITDYSSCSIDFVIQEKPLILYAPDMEQYLENIGLYGNKWQELCSNYAAKSTEELINSVIEYMTEPSKHLQLRNALEDYFEDREIRGTNYCENVYNVVTNNDKEKFHA